MTRKTTAMDYEVTCAREIDGQYRAIGDIVIMTPVQAKYYLPPYGDGLKPVAGKPAVAGKSSGKPAVSDAVSERAAKPPAGKAAKPASG